MSGNTDNVIQGDGLQDLLNFFDLLHKKTKDLRSCEIPIPDTVVYKRDFPVEYYSYKDGEILKKSGGDIDSNMIMKKILKPQKEGIPIQCYYLKCGDKNQTTIEYFGVKDVEDFIFKRENKGNGILQFFVPPKKDKNDLLRLIYTPNFLKIHRRENVHRMDDISFSLTEKCVTFEGKYVHSHDVLVAPVVKKRIKKLCDSICDHYFAVTKRKLVRMMLFFKLNPDSEIYLLWPSSIRVKMESLNIKSKLPPINLQHKYVTIEKKDKRKEGKNTCQRCGKLCSETLLVPSSDIVTYLKKVEKKEKIEKKKEKKRKRKMERMLSRKFDIVETKEEKKINDTDAYNEKKKLMDKKMEVCTKIESVLRELVDINYLVYDHFSRRKEKRCFIFDLDSSSIPEDSMERVKTFLLKNGVKFDQETSKYSVESIMEGNMLERNVTKIFGLFRKMRDDPNCVDMDGFSLTGEKKVCRLRSKTVCAVKLFAQKKKKEVKKNASKKKKDSGRRNFYGGRLSRLCENCVLKVTDKNCCMEMKKKDKSWENRLYFIKFNSPVNMKKMKRKFYQNYYHTQQEALRRRSCNVRKIKKDPEWKRHSSVWI